jgi:hypothetical protein
VLRRCGGHTARLLRMLAQLCAAYQTPCITRARGRAAMRAECSIQNTNILSKCSHSGRQPVMRFRCAARPLVYQMASQRISWLVARPGSIPLDDTDIGTVWFGEGDEAAGGSCCFPKWWRQPQRLAAEAAPKGCAGEHPQSPPLRAAERAPTGHPVGSVPGNLRRRVLWRSVQTKRGRSGAV